MSAASLWERVETVRVEWKGIVIGCVSLNFPGSLLSSGLVLGLSLALVKKTQFKYVFFKVHV